MNASAETGTLRAVFREATRFERSAVSVSGGLIAAIPVVLVFGVPIALGDPVVAATMAAGAMLVGIAWRVAGGSPPIAVLGVDALLMALSTFVGSATGSRPWLHLAIASTWALLAGLLVALGRRGSIVGTQAVIGMVVFGRFGEPIAGALGLAGLVLAGGLAMVGFVAVVRWPSPLKLQRSAAADAYRALADLAAGPSDASTLPAAGRLDEARAAIASPMLFGDPSVLELRNLLDEGSRLRVELRAIHVLRARELQTAGGAAMRRADELAASQLRSSASTLELIASVIEGDQHAARELDVLAGQRSDGLAPQLGEGAEANLLRRLAALRGQLRAVVRQAPAAAEHRSFFGRRPLTGTNSVRDTVGAAFAQLRASATLESPAGRHALRLAVVVAVAEAISQHIPLQRSYWMVVAAAAALRPEFSATLTRGAERIFGTCAGVALAGLIVVGLHPSLTVVVGMVGVLAWIAYAVFPASFAAGFTFVTALVVFLLDAVSSDTLATAGDRLLNTLVGGAIGLLAYVIWPTWSHRPARQALADLLGAQRSYLALVLASIGAGEHADEREVALQARRARIAYTSAQEAIARSLAEPTARRIDPERSQSVLGALRRLVSVIHVLRTGADDYMHRVPVPALARFAGEIDEALATIEQALPASLDGASPASLDGASPASLDGASPAALDLGDLRDGFDRVARSDSFPPAGAPLLDELDETVDALDTLAATVTGVADRQLTAATETVDSGR